MKILKCSHGPLNYIKYPCKNTKIPQKTKLFFVFFEAKSVILMYMEIRET